jgi:hypothetical protein
MKAYILTLCTLFIAGIAIAAPAPYPLPVNSRAARAPDVLAFAGHKMSYRVSFYDGSTRSDISSDTPFMSWSTNADDATTITATYSVVSAASGIVDFAFAPADLNYTAGTYIYEVGVLDGSGVPNIYRQGTFVLDGSPFGTGVKTNFSTPINWALYHFLATATDGPNRFAGAGQVTTTNADGSITVTIAGASISAVLPGTAIDVQTNGTTYTISVEGDPPFDLSGAPSDKLSMTNANGDTVALIETNITGTGSAQTKLWSMAGVKGYVDGRTIPMENIDAVGFRATMSNNQDNVADSTFVTVVADNETYDTDNGYDVTTYIYTFPATGIWNMAYSVFWQNIDDAKQAQVRLELVDGGVTNYPAVENQNGSTANSVMIFSGAGAYRVENAGATVKLQAFHANGDATPDLKKGTVGDGITQWGATLHGGK